MVNTQGIPKFAIVDTPTHIHAKRGPNRVLTALIKHACELPDGKSIQVTPKILGWKEDQQRSTFCNSLRVELKKRGATSLVVINDGASVFVARVNGNGGKV